MLNNKPVDIITDVMALTSYGNTKNIILVAIETKGRFDEDAFKSSVNEAVSIYPNYKSILREIHEGWAFYLTRESQPDMKIPILSEQLAISGSEGTLEAVVSHLTTRFDRQWDLWRLPPLEIHVLGIGEERRVLAFIAHHVAGDVTMVMRFITEVVGQYHARITGTAPSWTSSPYVLSTAKKRASTPKKFGWQGLFSQLKRDLAYRKKKSQKPLGSGRRNDLREWHVEKVISADETGRILKSFSKDGLHVVDHLVACANVALDAWNVERQIEPGHIASVVTVNMRERFGGSEEQNYSSAIFFNSDPDQRNDYHEFVGSVARKRNKQLGRQVDLSLRKSIARGAKFFSLFPIGIRRKAARLFMDFQRYSVAVGYLGVVWPDFKDEKMGAGSSLERIGDSDIIDIHGTAYKQAGTAYINLIVFIYRRQMHLVISSAADLLNKEECYGFAEVLVKTVFHAAGFH
jgi:hypothetical protein